MWFYSWLVRLLWTNFFLSLFILSVVFNFFIDNTNINEQVSEEKVKNNQ